MPTDRNRSSQALTKQQGFSLVEILFAVLILSVGILGMAGLQVTSIQENRSALLRGQAVELANSMLDRIRANPTAVYQSVTYSDAPTTATDCVSNSCNPTQLAQYDTADWKCSINSEDSSGTTYSTCTTLGSAGQLPDGAGQIQVNTTNHTVQVSVRWEDAQQGRTNTISLDTRIQ